MIRAQDDSNYVVTTMNAATGNSANVGIYQYSAASTPPTTNWNLSNDEWIFVRCDGDTAEKVTVAVQQDWSYLARYSDAGHPSEVNEVMADVGKPFYNLWHIELEPYYYNLSYVKAQDCSLSYSSGCTSSSCGSLCANRKDPPNHHKNFNYNALNSWSTYGRNGKNIRIVLSAANLCHLSAGAHSTGALGWWPSDLFSDGMAKQNRDHMLNVRVIQHEISHAFGCGHCGSTDERCIMSGGYDNIYIYNNYTIWCSDCYHDFKRLAH